MGNTIKSQPGDYYYKAYFSKFNIAHFFHKNKYDKIINLVPEGSIVLDAGCGSGIVSYLLEKKGCKIIGIDIDNNCIKFASKICKGKFYKKNLLNLDLDRKFDIILCIDVIEHFSRKDLVKVTENLRNHLKRGGKIIFAFPSFLYIRILEPIWKIIRKIIYPKMKFDDEDIHRLINVNNFMSMLNKLGLRCFKKKYFNFYLNYYIICGF